MGRALAAAPVDVACVGIGENGHLAFNDPPADFETREPYIVVTLDEACRRQQVGEGWFSSLADVPARAISMSVRQILEARRILCVVPDQRKAEAVRAALEGPVTPAVPASILQTHPDVTVFLDRGFGVAPRAALTRRRIFPRVLTCPFPRSLESAALESVTTPTAGGSALRLNAGARSRQEYTRPPIGSTGRRPFCLCARHDSRGPRA